MGSLSESVEVRRAGPGEREAELRPLDRPWIADEGPLDCALARDRDPAGLGPRGLAFDRRVTVAWDEAGVRVARVAPADSAVVALESPVLLRDGFPGPRGLRRIDYLRKGALVASRYTWDPEPGEEESDA